MTFNPFDIQKQMFAEFEKNLGEYMQKTMREPVFMKLVAQNMATNLDLRTVVKQQLESMLRSLDIPTQESLSQLYKTVHDLETRLLDLEERFEDLGETMAKRGQLADPEPKTAAAKPAKRKTVTKRSTK